MTYIPDCRTDENYNQKYLNNTDKNYVDGFDFCAEDVIPLFFDNMDIYEHEFDIQGEDINLVRFLENHPIVGDTLAQCMSHYIEMHRDELIISMLEDMDEDEYEEIKKRVDAE